MTPTDRLQRLREGCARLIRASEQLSTPRILGIVGPVALAAVSAGLFLILSEAGSTPARSQGTAQLRPTQAFSGTATPSATQVSKLDCAAQQWPYVDQRCAKQNGETPSSNGMRKVRIIGQDGKSRIIMSARPDLAPTETAQAARTTMATKSDSAPLTPLDYKPAKTETAQTDAPAAAQTASNETTGSAPAVDSVVDVSATHRVVDQTAAKAEKKAKAKRARAAKIAAGAAREHQAARKHSNPGDTIAMVRSLPDQSDSRHVTVRYGYGNDDRDGFSRFYVVPASSNETW
jgi:hypothetical protein